MTYDPVAEPARQPASATTSLARAAKDRRANLLPMSTGNRVRSRSQDDSPEDRTAPDRPAVLVPRDRRRTATSRPLRSKGLPRALHGPQADAAQDAWSAVPPRSVRRSVAPVPPGSGEHQSWHYRSVSLLLLAVVAGCSHGPGLAGAERPMELMHAKLSITIARGDQSDRATP
jgi:hypothetical protein